MNATHLLDQKTNQKSQDDVGISSGLKMPSSEANISVGKIVASCFNIGLAFREDLNSITGL